MGVTLSLSPSGSQTHTVSVILICIDWYKPDVTFICIDYYYCKINKETVAWLNRLHQQISQNRSFLGWIIKT